MVFCSLKQSWGRTGFDPGTKLTGCTRRMVLGLLKPNQNVNDNIVNVDFGGAIRPVALAA